MASRGTTNVSTAAQLASLFEVSSYKPGNVHPGSDFSDTSYEDFLAGSLAIGRVIGIAYERGLLAGKGKNLSIAEIKIGELIRDCASDVKKSHKKGGNTHLGMILLMIPISAAYGYKTNSLEILGETVTKILKGATVEDTLNFYKAVKLSKVNVGVEKLKEPRVPFHEMLCTSAIRDRIAEDLVSDLRITRFTEKVIERNYSELRDIRNAIIQSYLELLAAYPDTLIAKKRCRDKAEEVSLRAEKIVELGGVKTKEGLREIKKFDKYLRAKGKNDLNPGTTADIIAAALMLSFLRSLTPRKNREQP